MKWLQKKMQGRYGSDQLSMTLLIIGLIISISGIFLNFKYLSIVSYVLLFIVLFRTFSKNIRQRGLENYKFMIKVSPIYSFFTKKKKHHEIKKDSKIITCPQCKQKMKVPKKRGKILVTCPRCKHKIDAKS